MLKSLRVVLALSLIAGSAALLTPGCGGDSSSSPTTPSVTAPTINGTTDMVYIGQRVTFTATGTSVTWGGDSPSVATVDATTGAVTGVGTGRVTIWAENSGGRATRLLRVLPSYNGKWSGSYSLTGCQASGDFASIEFCGSFFQGQILNMGFDLTQSRDQVTGTFSLGDLLGTLASSVVSDDGSLPLTGVISYEGLVIQLQNLRATSPSAGTMKGQFDQVWGAPDASGTGRLVCDIRDVTRMSGAPTMRSFSQGAGSPALTLEQAIAAVLRR